MYSIGIDIGGMSAKLGVVENGMIKNSRIIPTSSNLEYEHFLSQIEAAYGELVAMEKEQGPRIIGISSCGLIDSSQGRITYSNNIKWENKNIAADLEKKLHVPVKLANDAKCALLAEAVIGAGKAYDRVCMITLGTGVGGAYITGKRLETGNPYADASGILGHIIVNAGGRECTCGHRGCLETYASSTAIMTSYKEKTGAWKTTKDIFDQVRMGDPVSKEVLDEFKYYLGEGLVSIGNILRPQIIIIGGGVSKSSDLFIPYLEEYVNNGIFGGNAIPVCIREAELGNDAGMIGATLL